MIQRNANVVNVVRATARSALSKEVNDAKIL